MKEKTQLFLREYQQLHDAWFNAKIHGDLELAKNMEAQKQTLAWVLNELGHGKEVMDINQGVWQDK